MFSTKRSRQSSSNSYQLLSSSSSSAAIIANNDDILTLILLCLPPKSLIKFKTVSKHWLSLITDPRFSLKLNSRTVSGLFVRRQSCQINAEYDFINLSPHASRAPFRSLTFVDNPSGISLLQSCNGLMLCCSFRASHPEKTYYIYNPTTKHYTVLPALGGGPRGGISREILGISLAFDPSKSPHYKVICIRNCDSDLPDHYQVEIYSSRTGPWRPSGSPFAAPISVQFCNGVFWNGAIHWISNRGGSLCFDVEEEKIRDLPMPASVGGVRIDRYFGGSGRHLHLVEVYDTLQLDAYEMERDFSGWSVKYQVDLNPIAAAFPEMARGDGDPIDLYPYIFSILGFVQEETYDDLFMVLHIPNKVIRYNFKDNTLRKLHDFGPICTRVGGHNSLEFESYDAFQFIESFACV